MEKLNSAKSGELKLPIGFRFHPTDEELIVHYLKRKVYSLPLPASIIPELDVFQTNPWDLPGDSKEKRYFFSKRKSRIQSKCCNTVTAGLGYWKASVGEGKQILALGNNRPVAMKKTLFFYNEKRTPWIMHEYFLLDSRPPNSAQSCMMPVGEWSVCRIYQKKRKGKNHGINPRQPNSNKTTSIESNRSSIVELMISMEDSISGLGPPQPSPSCSSGITEITPPSEIDDEEASSYYNHL